MNNKSGWNYRQVKSYHHHSYVKNGVHISQEEINVSLYEVYYDENGHIDYWSTEPVSVSSCGGESVKITLDLMLLSLDKPMLIFEKKNDGTEKLVEEKNQ